MAEYNKKKSEQEAEERCATRMHNSPYDKIREALEELKAVSHPNEEQEQLQDILRPTALRTHDGRTHSRLPARSASHRQENQSQRKPAFKRLGPSGSHNRESRRDHSQSNRVEQPRESRSRVPIQIAPGTTLTRTITLLPPRRKIWHSRLAKRRGAKQKLIKIAQVMMRLMMQALLS